MIDSVHYSDVMRWLRCGVQHEFVMKGIRIPPGISARRGSSVHSAADYNHKEKIKTGKDEPLSVLKDAAHEKLKSYLDEGNYYLPPSEHGRRQTLEGETEKQTIGAVTLYHKEVAPLINPVDSEKRLDADLGFSLPIQGTLDVDNADNSIIDLKVMKTKDQGWADSELQPTFYSYLKYANSGKWPKEFRYHLMVPNKEPKHVQLITTRTQYDVQILKQYIELYLQDMRTGIFRPCDPTFWLCSPEWCGYHQICKFYRRKR